MLPRQFIAAVWSPAGKGLIYLLSLRCLIVFWHFPAWYPGSGVVLDCIDRLSLTPFLLSFSHYHLLILTASFVLSSIKMPNRDNPLW